MSDPLDMAEARAGNLGWIPSCCTRYFLAHLYCTTNSVIVPYRREQSVVLHFSLLSDLDAFLLTQAANPPTFTSHLFFPLCDSATVHLQIPAAFQEATPVARALISLFDHPKPHRHKGAKEEAREREGKVEVKRERERESEKEREREKKDPYRHPFPTGQ